MSAYKGVTLESSPTGMWPIPAEPTVGSALRGRVRAIDEGSIKPFLLRLMAFQQPDTIFGFSDHRKQLLETAGECGQAGHVPLASQALGAIGSSEKGRSTQSWTDT